MQGVSTLTIFWLKIKQNFLKYFQFSIPGEEDTDGMLAEAVSDVSVVVEAPMEAESVSPPVSPVCFLSELAVVVSASASASAAAAVVVLAAAAGGGGCVGGATLTLATTVEYCCISITAASSKTCSRTFYHHHQFIVQSNIG